MIAELSLLAAGFFIGFAVGALTHYWGSLALARRNVRIARAIPVADVGIEPPRLSPLYPDDGDGGGA